MILESAILNVRPDQTEAFEVAFRELSASSVRPLATCLMNSNAVSSTRTAICSWSVGNGSKTTRSASGNRSRISDGRHCSITSTTLFPSSNTMSPFKVPSNLLPHTDPPRRLRFRHRSATTTHQPRGRLSDGPGGRHVRAQSMTRANRAFAGIVGGIALLVAGAYGLFGASSVLVGAVGLLIATGCLVVLLITGIAGEKSDPSESPGGRMGTTCSCSAEAWLYLCSLEASLSMASPSSLG